MAGLALLRIAPFISATSSVTFTFAEDVFVRPLVHTAPSTREIELRGHANRILPAFVHGFFKRGIVLILVSYPLSFATAIANLSRSENGAVSFASDAPPLARAAAGFYLAGLFFSVMHFPFAFWAMPPLDMAKADGGKDDDPKKDNTAAIGTWLTVNAWRGALADFPSWICYFVAFMCASA
jgi:hypothetical protein